MTAFPGVVVVQRQTFGLGTYRSPATAAMNELRAALDAAKGE